MLWTIFVVLVILWLLGFSLHVGGGLIYLLLVAAAVVLILQLGERSTKCRGVRFRIRSVDVEPNTTATTSHGFTKSVNRPDRARTSPQVI